MSDGLNVKSRADRTQRLMPSDVIVLRANDDTICKTGLPARVGQIEIIFWHEKVSRNISQIISPMGGPWFKIKPWASHKDTLKCVL